ERDGTIVLLGRGSVCINTGGEKVFPEEVESVLKSHPHVYDVLVVGVPDDRWGERGTAVVQPDPGQSVTLEELDAHCRARRAGWRATRSPGRSCWSTRSCALPRARPTTAGPSRSRPPPSRPAEPRRGPGPREAGFSGGWAPGRWAPGRRRFPAGAAGTGARCP